MPTRRLGLGRREHDVGEAFALQSQHAQLDHLVDECRDARGELVLVRHEGEQHPDRERVVQHGEAAEPDDRDPLDAEHEPVGGTEAEPQLLRGEVLVHGVHDEVQPARTRSVPAHDSFSPVGRPVRIVPAPIAHIAPDPVEPAFDPGAFAARLTRRRTGVKRALLDQSLISGVGNIYADEALWRARMHWARPTETLNRGEVSRLLDAVRDVLTEALKAGGTSFDSLYVNVNGESGYFDRSLQVYGREGEPCSRCATPIRRDSFMNRSAYSCPRCQPRPRNAHW